MTKLGEVNMDMLKGIAVVIDDRIRIDGQDKINKIIERVHAKGIPTTEFKDIDSAEKCIHNFLTVNFIILDWKMEELPADKVSGDISTIGVQAASVTVSDEQKKVIPQKSVKT